MNDKGLKLGLIENLDDLRNENLKVQYMPSGLTLVTGIQSL